MLIVTSLLVMGQASQKKIVEADEFVLRDNMGSVRARLSMNVPTGAAPVFLPLLNSSYSMRRERKESCWMEG